MKNTYNIVIEGKGNSKKVFIVISESERRLVFTIKYQDSKPIMRQSQVVNLGALMDVVGFDYFLKVLIRLYQKILELPALGPNVQNHWIGTHAIEIEMPQLVVH